MKDTNSYIGKQFGNYRVITKIASGGFASVYKGEHTILTERIVAIKVLHTRLNLEKERENFLQEAHLLEKLKHPYILPIFDVGISEGFPYLVTEYASNSSLSDYLKRQSKHVLPLQDALTILSQIGQALYCAHQHNIVHRDLKPDNILFNAKGEALLADFGIAIMLNAARTQTADFIGTPYYMSPEQFDGLASTKSDQYALGVIAYELLTGQKPFSLPPEAEDVWLALGIQHKTKDPIPPAQLNTSLPIRIEQAILKAMAKEREKRYPDISTFVRALGIFSIPQAPIATIKAVQRSLDELNNKLIPSITLPSPVDQKTIHSKKIWNIPYRRNPFFTGREDLLLYLYDQLNKNKTTALTQAQAINGLGGIGKTQTAVEYAYRYRNKYRFVFWIRAATRETLLADFVTLALLLHLPERDAQDQNLILKIVKDWMAEQENWLLILDNVDDLDLISDFLPTGNNGHILITTRAQAVGSIARSITVEKMSKHEGDLLLLRRAGILAIEASIDQATETDRTQAEAIVAAMDGLPLALDQAGAYIEETGCGLSRYLDLYLTHRKDLLQRRSQVPTGHPEPVTMTWLLSFQRIEQTNQAAADLLRLCSFLDSDTIPEEAIIEGAPDLGSALGPVASDKLKWDHTIAEVLRYSLFQRNTNTQTLSIHRLVQAVLKDAMSQELQQLWAERAIRVISRVFPESEVGTWSRCQRLLPQAMICKTLIDQYKLTFSEAAQLLYQAGSYLHDHAQYSQAVPLYQQAQLIYEQTLGSQHPTTFLVRETYAALLRKMRREQETATLEAHSSHAVRRSHISATNIAAQHRSRVPLWPKRIIITVSFLLFLVMSSYLVMSSLLAYTTINKKSVADKQILNVIPNQVRVNDTFVLTGRGFGTNDKISFTYDDNYLLLDGRGSRLEAHADDTGAFSLRVTIPSNWKVGPHEIFATDIGSEKSISVRVIIVVEQSSLAPPLLQLSNSSLDFGTNTSGSVSEKTITPINGTIPNWVLD